MMRKNPVFLLCVFVFLLRNAAAAADPWVKSIGDGFGDTSNEGVGWIQGFNGSIYVALDRASPSTGGAVMYRSADLTNWIKVVGTGTGTILADSTTEIIRILANGTNGLYFGTHDSASNPARVYDSTDGTNWTHITTPANGYAPSGNSSIGGLAVQGTNLFVATVNLNGAQIWRSRLNGTGFTNVANFANGHNLATGVNTNINFVSYLYAATNGTVYASTSHLVDGAPAAPQNGFLYQTSNNGLSWTQNSGVGNGFGDPNNWHIACMEEFRGCLYASLNNSVAGGQLWCTANGTNWTQVLTNGINDARNVELHHLSVDSGFLWVATLPQPGFFDEVWRSSDGTNFTQSNLPSFGDPNNCSRFPSVGGLASNELFGTRNTVTGAQIWRLGPINTCPSLLAGLTNSSFLLTWPVMALDFKLESVTNLAPATAWQPCANTPAISNSQKYVAVPIVSTSQFYRLRKP